MCSVASASGRRAWRWHAFEVTAALPLRDCGLRHIDCLVALIREFSTRGAMRISFWRFVLIVATAVSLIGYPKAASATTVDVTVGPNGDLVFSPSSVTIHPGDQVRWTFSSSGHSTTSGSPGMPNGIWDSGIRNQGATFTRTFNSVGTFPVLLHSAWWMLQHGGHRQSGCPSPTPTPTATPRYPTPGHATATDPTAHRQPPTPPRPTANLTNAYAHADSNAYPYTYSGYRCRQPT